MRKHFLNILTVLIILAGIALMFYPFFSEWYSNVHHAKVIKTYNQKVESKTEKELDAERKKAEEYNRNLLGKVILTDPFDPKNKIEDTGDYSSILNVDGNGMMGDIRIPSIDVNLPIYHGTTSDILAKGVGHLEYTSFPVGGKSTHTVLSAHTGIPSAELFTNLDKVKIGDIFYLDVLDKTLAYKVDQIKVVLPTDTSDLRIVRNKDYATLVTCTPYGINSHRLLVRGIRTKYVKAKDKDTSYNLVNSLRLRLLIICIVSLFLVILILYLLYRRRKKKEDNQNHN
ncbi:MAG: class C sortase [Lachnospiraceae bacterium]|jgi:sortase A|nr:class C sortase [Lachnospiraceae bacterium]